MAKIEHKAKNHFFSLIIDIVVFSIMLFFLLVFLFLSF